MDNLQHLFSQLQLFELKYQKIEEASIDSFNIFSILRKSSDEVNLHSKFIVDFSTLNINISKEKFNIDILKVNYFDE